MGKHEMAMNVHVITMGMIGEHEIAMNVHEITIDVLVYEISECR